MSSRLKFKRGKQKELVLKVIEEYFGSQRAFAEFLGYSRRAIRNWISEEALLPKSVFTKICNKFCTFSSYSKFIEKELSSNWGAKKGGNSCIEKRKDLHNYLSYVRSFISANSEAERLSKKKNYSHPILDELINDNVDLMAILAVCLLTDGSLSTDGRSHRIAFFSKDPILRDLSKALISKLSRFNPSVDLGTKGTWLVRVTDNHLAKKLFDLSPEYRTFPPEGNLQPTISFLDGANHSTNKWAIRFAFTTDGCIILTKKGKPELNLACYNRSNSEEWKKLLVDFDIRANIAKDKSSKQGCKGIRIWDHKSILNFYKIGGFITGVKISKKSKKHCGMEKNELLKKVVEMINSR